MMIEIVKLLVRLVLMETAVVLVLVPMGMVVIGTVAVVLVGKAAMPVVGTAMVPAVEMVVQIAQE